MHSGELLPNALKIFVRHMSEFDQSRPRTVDTHWFIVL